MHSRPLRYLGLSTLLTLLGACATAPAPVKGPETYFKEGEAAYASRHFEDAIAQFKKVKESYSNPELTAQAELKIADAHFENGAFIEAAAAYEDFRKLHPSNEKAPYALYRLGLANYNQITGIDTDQTAVKNSVHYLEMFLAQYPGSEYTEDAKAKLADCRAKELAYENYVGNFYLRTKKYPSAIKRLSEALQRFPGEPGLADTLFYLQQAYLKSGDTARAEEVAKRLETEYPAKAREAKGEEPKGEGAKPAAGKDELPMIIFK
ncbi:outer membrane protein assembly factor BamD [Geomonas subterranea]|uniref:Outer membrane protein assembly factor BamD n=1 Tax=Geomonas subterranea TaxID=2847989 RepID=A0ABX8LDZ0_9BACT|nr:MULTISPECIES: outer membrane protein assembly factor BamD [Geomonas]QXE89531.1 outer membrane protein assembly factor BamD [Geomonas subterranea]QXM08354.1 outer membrane protein assembly factor BamD [Geomonas subterranea]